MNIEGFFPNLALVEFRTKLIRIMRGPGEYEYFVKRQGSKIFENCDLTHKSNDEY